MSRQLGHPDPAALARLSAPGLRAGLAGSRRSRRLSAHVARCPRCARVCAQLDMVSAVLSAVPVPSLPRATERRVLTALAHEAESRRRHPGLSPMPGHPHHQQSSRVIAGGRMLLPAAAGLLVLCAGLGYLTLGAPQRAASHGTAARLGFSPASAGVRGPGSGEKARSARTLAFVVTDTNTRYSKTTLRTQVRDRLQADISVPAITPDQPVSSSEAPTVSASVSASSPAPSPASGAPGDAVPPTVAPPSKSLVGCVMHLTGDVRPKFVDRAIYQSEPVYVIAVSTEAWVVGIGCTATRPSVIASVRLTATS